MFRAKVVRSFVCRRTKRFYEVGSVYRSRTRERMEELAAGGYIEFEQTESDG